MLLGLSQSVSPQVGASGVNGSVVDGNGAPIPTATITIISVATGFERSTRSTEQGNYSLNALPAGTYTIKADASGFAPVQQENLILAAGGIQVVNFTLRPAAVEGSVTVTDSSAEISTNLNQTVIQNLPVLNRSFLLLAQIAPSTQRGVPDVSVNGASLADNKYVVDGSDATNATTGGPATTPAADTVGNFQVVTANFSAEVGKPGNSLLNIAVKSGTNDLHGTGFFYFRDDSLQAKGPFGGVSKPPFGSQRFGGTLGGPIKKNVAFFFVALERNRDNEVTTSGTRDTIRRRIVQTFARVPFYSTMLTSRVDVNLSNNNSMTARYSLTDGHGVIPGTSQGARLQEESNFQSQSDRQHQLTASWSRTFSSFTNVALVNFLTFRNESRPVTTAPQIVFPSINVGANFRADQTTYQRRSN